MSYKKLELHLCLGNQEAATLCQYEPPLCVYPCWHTHVLALVYLAWALPLFSLATSGRIRASVLSTRSSSPACSVREAVLKFGKKKASSLLARSLSSLPCTALNSVCVPYCARKLQEARGEKGEESRWLLGWCSTREKHNSWVCLTEQARMCCSFGVFFVRLCHTAAINCMNKALWNKQMFFFTKTQE